MANNLNSSCNNSEGKLENGGGGGGAVVDETLVPRFCPHWSTVAILAPLGYYGHHSLYLAIVTGLYYISVMV